MEFGAAGGEPVSQDHGEYRPDAGEDLADIVTAAAEDREDSIADCALERAAGEASVGFHVADLGLDGAAASEQFRQHRCDALPGAADQYFGPRDPMPAVAAIDDGERWSAVGQDFDLLQRLRQCVAVIRVARQGAHANDKALVDGGGDADLGAKFVADACLAFGDAVDLGLVQGVDLVAALELFQRLTHLLELPGMGVTDHLQLQRRRQPVVILPQLLPSSTARSTNWRWAFS